VKKLSTGLLVILSMLSFAAPHEHPVGDPPGMHGMLLFGAKKFYLSHLPMFHKPHDYQAILEVEFEDHANEIYLSSMAKDPSEKIYTIAPEVFVLPDVVEGMKSFKTAIFKGHFERGGKEIVRHTIAKITKVILFKKFDPTEKKADVPSYLIFGSVFEPFMTHLITSAPDFDHILSVTNLPAAIVRQLVIDGKVIHSFPQMSANEPIPETNTEIGKLNEIYLEIDELK
jgi:hypothetical protein